MEAWRERERERVYPLYCFEMREREGSSNMEREKIIKLLNAKLQ